MHLGFSFSIRWSFWWSTESIRWKNFFNCARKLFVIIKWSDEEERFYFFIWCSSPVKARTSRNFLCLKRTSQFTNFRRYLPHDKGPKDFQLYQKIKMTLLDACMHWDFSLELLLNYRNKNEESKEELLNIFVSKYIKSLVELIENLTFIESQHKQ